MSAAPSVRIDASPQLDALGSLLLRGEEALFPAEAGVALAVRGLAPGTPGPEGSVADTARAAAAAGASALAGASAAEGEAAAHPAERAVVANASPKRRREFLAGRGCAREALRALGCREAEAPILRGADRLPLWPRGFVGSISHTRELAVAAVAPQHITLGLGIDVEGAAPLEERLIRRICRADEMEALAARPERSLGAWAKLVFSAKEAFTKACFPLTRVPLGFQDAQVELLPGANRFLVRLCNDAKPAIAGRRRLEGRFVFHGALLFAAVVVPGAPA